jgi:hypothetical protein
VRLGRNGARRQGSLSWNSNVLIAVADLGSAARKIEARHGLTSIEGGRLAA